MSADQEAMIQPRKVMVEILNEFVRVCEENHLTYFLFGGTLLGAVRHKGFIPWDDDIDVAMPRNDYEKFLDIYNNNDNTNYYLVSERQLPYCKPYARLCKKGTVFAVDYLLPDDYFGICVDIFPYDNCVLFFLPLQTYMLPLSWKLYRLKIKVDIPKKRIKVFLNKILCKLIPLSLSKFLLKTSYTFFNIFNTKYISFFSGIYGYKKETHKYNTIYPLSKIIFEGQYYCAPSNYDKFLTAVYGNYMEIPPIEQRKKLPEYIIFDIKDDKYYDKISSLYKNNKYLK